VRPKDAGAAEGVSGPVIIRKVMPSELGAIEKEAGHKVMGVGHVVGQTWGLLQGGLAGCDGVGVGVVACGVGFGEGARGRVGIGVEAGVGSREGF
jgi:hypothetical protein